MGITDHKTIQNPSIFSGKLCRLSPRCSASRADRVECEAEGLKVKGELRFIAYFLPTPTQWFILAREVFEVPCFLLVVSKPDPELLLRYEVPRPILGSCWVPLGALDSGKSPSNWGWCSPWEMLLLYGTAKRWKGKVLVKYGQMKVWRFWWLHKAIQLSWKGTNAATKLQVSGQSFLSSPVISWFINHSKTPINYSCIYHKP